MNNPLASFRLKPQDFRYTGHALDRPECVLALPDGALLASDRGTAVVCICPDGSQIRYGRGGGLPNGLAIDDRGDVLIADMQRGVVQTLDTCDNVRGLYEHCRGQPLGAVNFILADEEPGVVWISSSTSRSPYHLAISQPEPDGRIYRVSSGSLSVAAEGLCFPNEMRIDHDSRMIYAVETTAGRVVRAPLLEDQTIGDFAPFGPDPLYPGAYPDGIAFDSQGNLWVTELSQNAILVLDRNGSLHKIFDDPSGEILNKPTSLAFGGPDLCTVAVGTLKMHALPVFTSPVPGQPMPHWRPQSRHFCK
jgi:sugar lactone lactonase YvrE